MKSEVTTMNMTHLEALKALANEAREAYYAHKRPESFPSPKAEIAWDIEDHRLCMAFVHTKNAYAREIDRALEAA